MTSEPKSNSDEEKRLKEKIEYLLKIIGRYDLYVNSTHSKASLVIAWNGIVIGTVLLKFEELLRNFQPSGWKFLIARFLLVAIGFLGVFSVALVFKVIFPFLKPTSREAKGELLRPESALFFGSVCRLTGAEYLRQVSGMDLAGMLSDLADQAVVLARGLDSKMRLLRIGVTFILAQLALVLGLVLLKFISV